MNVSVIALHGFNSCGKEFKDKIQDLIPAGVRSHFLTAPLRRITVYDNQWYRSWHDYFTNYGDHNIQKEESIDESHVLEVRYMLHRMIKKEYEKNNTVVVVGESQGACCAIDAGMTSDVPVTVIELYGQRYKMTPLSNHSKIHAFHGGKDIVIPLKVAQDSLPNTHFVVAPSFHHAQSGSALFRFMQNAFSLIK